MQTKLFEIRDSMTCLVVLCVKVWQWDFRHEDPNERLMRMAWRSGYKDSRAIIMTRLAEPSRGAQCDPYDWGDRTLTAAHAYIEQHWDTLPDGAMIDVRVALGEVTHAPSESEFPDPPEHQTIFKALLPKERKHDFADDKNTGLCDTCGMPREEHSK